MGANRAKSTTWEKIRNAFQQVHLWMGLISGLFVIVICFSGTVYVYNTELTEKAASHLYQVKVPQNAQRIAPELIFDKIKEASGGKITSIQIPASPSRTYQFSTRKEGDNSRSGVTYMVNPYTGEIVGNSTETTKTKEFMRSMFSLHRWLLFDRIETPIFKSMTNRELGSKISGWATILFTLGCITGIVIWFPKRVRNWKQGLKIKWTGNWKRLNHDLHNTLAFYSLFFLLVMGLTGPQWSFPWYREGLQNTLGTYKAPAPKSEEKKEKPTPENKPDSLANEPTLLPLAQYIAAVDSALPYEGNYSISLPDNAKAPVNISKTKIGFFAPAASDKITLNQSTAEVTKLDIFRQKKFNERIAGSIKALHVGNVYGGFSKLLYFITCLIATSLPITGTIIWLNRLKKNRKRKQSKLIV